MRFFLRFFFFIVFTGSLVEVSAQRIGDRLDFVMDMVHNNPGEKPYITKYNDPMYMREQGFNGMVTHWFVNCAITYDNYCNGILKPDTDERKWIERQAVVIDEKLAACKKAEIEVYPFTDFIVLPQAIWKQYRAEIEGKEKVIGDGGMQERIAKPDMQSKKTQDLLRAQITGIFERFPDLGGLTTRFGETYLHDTPYHMGGGPIREGMEGVEDQITFLNILREEICVKRNKKLFFRTWDFGYNFHTNPTYYMAVTTKIEPHSNLYFVIKYQQDDFHRMTPFNPTLGIGIHPQIVEAQSRMEAYGKGAHPYYTSRGVIDGWPESKYEIEFGSHAFTGKLNDLSNPRGIKDMLSNGLLKGVLTWSHGGGWDGPYINHEIWTDLNTYVVSQWARDTQRTEEEIFYQFAKDQLGLIGYQADLFRRLCILSEEGVRKGQLNSYTFNNVWWTRDQYFSVRDNENVIQSIVKKGLQDKVLSEKKEATAIWRQIEAIAEQLEIPDVDCKEAIVTSSRYGRIKYQLIEQMWIMMIQDAYVRNNKPYALNQITQAIKEYEHLWDEWSALADSSRFCASLYTDLAFRNNNSGSIKELICKMKQLVDAQK